MWKKLLTSVCTGVLLFSLSVCNVFAASQTGTTQKQAYTYKVTIYAGNQGTFSGAEGLVLSNKDAVITQTEDKIVVSGLNFGDQVAYTAQTDVKLDSASKYYVQGIRLGGRDNDTIAASAFIVDGDTDYVVAYGIKGNQVSYTVNYHDANGKEMLPSETYYGNVGDKPVIACKYVDGYSPQASGLTKTLQQDAAKNVLTFIYSPIPGPTVEDVVNVVTREEYVDVVVGGTQIGDVGGTTGAGGNGAGQNGTGGTGTVGGNGEAGNAGGNGEAENAGGNGEAGNVEAENAGENEESGTGNGESGTAGGNEGNGATDENAEPSEDLIIDLDDEEVPLANVENEGNEQQDVTMVKYLAIIAVAVIALVILIITAVVRKKRDNVAEEEA